VTVAILGPEVSWYLAVAAFLFATGAFGVLLRRSPLIAFARHHGSGAGQIFALAVMAVAASEVVVGLGLIVAISRRHLDLDVDKLRTLRG
jgi:NADH-quinone oxidoreductase subunit K